MEQLRLRRIGPQHRIESHEHSDPYRDTGERIGDGPAKVLRVEDTEVKRVQKCDYHIGPCANESLFFEGVRYRSSSYREEWQQQPRKIDQNARKEDRSDQHHSI